MYFGLFSIFVIKPIQPDCDKIKGISVLLLETPLTRSKYFSPYTHAQHLTRTPITFCTFAYKQNPSLVENPISRGRRDKFWIVSSGLRPYSDFSKHSRKSRTSSASNQIQGEVHIHIITSASTKKRDK